MYKNHHPNSYIRGIRNTESGLSARTKILLSLEEGKSTVKDISGAVEISYSSALHHLHLLRMNKIVERTNLKVPYYWKTTGVGHARLNEFKK
jgi:predicted transcriptional regulator